MGFRRQLAVWAITGGLRHTALLGAALAAVLALLAVAALGATVAAARVALPMIDDAADRGWAAALAPLSSAPERYPLTRTGESALRLEGLAASLGIALGAAEAAGGGPPPAAAINADTFAAIVELLSSSSAPVWAMDISDCDGTPATSPRGHLRLQRLLLAAATIALENGRSSEAERFLEASWQLNDPLLRSPEVSIHRTACTVIEQEMAILRRLPEPGQQWRVRLAPLDLERHALEAYRFEAWRLRCRSGRLLSDVHPLLGAVTEPVARIAAHQQHEAMLFAVRELPLRDIRTFDADAFVAEQHARVPRFNPIARSALPVDWSSWPDSVRANLDVELALRVLELRARWRDQPAGDAPPLERRQPSRADGADWIYDVGPEGVTIALDAAGWRSTDELPLRATVTPPHRGASR